MHIDCSPDPIPSSGSGRPPQPVSKTVFTKCIRLTQQNFTDLAGRFPFTSYTGHNYILIMYAEDPNYIHAELLRSRAATEFARAYQEGFTFFEEHGFQPAWERLDNETSALMTQIARKLNVQTQYSPPGNHRTNRAERAIQTFKNHFISVLCSTDPNFPMGAWDKLIGQAELTLNLLRGSRINPAISAWGQIHGPFDNLSTPIAPAGTRVLAYESPAQRSSWASHGIPGFYIGPALSHYRCFQVLRKKTNHGGDDAVTPIQA